MSKITATATPKSQAPILPLSSRSWEWMHFGCDDNASGVDECGLRQEDVTLLKKDESIISPNKILWYFTNKDLLEILVGCKQTLTECWIYQPNFNDKSIVVFHACLRFCEYSCKYSTNLLESSTFLVCHLINSWCCGFSHSSGGRAGVPLKQGQFLSGLWVWSSGSGTIRVPGPYGLAHGALPWAIYSEILFGHCRAFIVSWHTLFHWGCCGYVILQSCFWIGLRSVLVSLPGGKPFQNFLRLYNQIIGIKSSYFIAVYACTCFGMVNYTPLPAGHFVDVDLYRCLGFSVISCVLLSLMQFYRIFRFMGRNLIAVRVLICFIIVSCIQLPVCHYMYVDLSRRLFLLVSPFELQAFVRVCRGPSAESVRNFLQCNSIASKKDFIFRTIQFGCVFMSPEKFGRFGIVAVVSSGIALGMQSCRIFFQRSFDNPHLGTECVLCLLTHLEISTVTNHYMVGSETGDFGCLAFLLCGTGFSWIGEQFFLLVARNLDIAFRSKVGNLRQTFRRFSSAASSGVSLYYREVGKVFHHAPGIGKFCLGLRKVPRWFTFFRSWLLIFSVAVQSADGAELESYSMGSASEYPLPQGEPSSHSRISMSWAVPFICSAFCLIFTWVLPKWWRILPVSYFVDRSESSMIRAMFDRITEENNSLRRQVNLLNGQLSEISSVVRGLREDLYAASADHERLAEQVDWQHVGIVRLGGFGPFQSLSIDQRQQIFARERRNMMAYRAVGPDRFMATVRHQDRLLGLRSDFSAVGGVGARLDYPRGESPADNYPLTEFNDVGDGAGLPQDVLWAIARNKLQIELHNCLVREDFLTARLFQQMLLFFIYVSHQDRTLGRQDQEHLFAGLGDRLESLSEGLRGEDEARAEYYLSLAGKFRRLAFPRPTWIV